MRELRIFRRNKKQIGQEIEQKGQFFLEEIQPAGGITFKNDSYILTGNGYQTCLHIYGYPQKLKNHWLAALCNISGTIATVDVSTTDINDVKRNINRSMQEQEMRYSMTEVYSDQRDAQKRYQEMKLLYDEISEMKEVIKQVHIRIYVGGKTLKEMEDNLKKIRTSLDASGYKAAVFLNEMEAEWKALYLPYRKQQEIQFSIEGQPLSSSALSGGNPFHFSSLEDPKGSLLGFTPCGGSFLFDLFHSDNSRKNYNAVVSGLMGSGKSTLLKKIFKDRAMRGDFVRTFDITGEFTDLTKEFGGQILVLDGSQGILNPLEILKSDENEANNYAMHITKLLTFYRLLKPEADTEETNKFQELLDELYNEYGLKPVSEKEEKQITGLPVERYPVFSDMLAFIEKKVQKAKGGNYNELERELQLYDMLLIQKVRNTIKGNILAFGSLFDGHTSIKITDEQIITFNIRALTRMPNNIFQAFVVNMLTLCWNDSLINGSIMKRRYENGEISFDEVVRFLIIIDEAPRIINTQYLQAVEIIKQIMREGRKYFIGIIIAAQSIHDFFPSKDENKVKELSVLFELSLYKFIFQQDTSAVGFIKMIFEGNLSDEQAANIPSLQRGECYLNMVGYKTYSLQVYASQEELRLFSGGV